MSEHFFKYKPFYLITIVTAIACLVFFTNDEKILADDMPIVKWDDAQGKWKYAEKILELKLLEGMNKSEIIEKLGEPDSRKNNTRIYYSHRPTFGLDDIYFKIYFDENGIFKSGKIEQG